MANALKNFVIGESDFSEAEGLLEKIISAAAEENVTPAQYMVAMLWHAMKGHDLSVIHFDQDGSGDTYNTEVLDKMFKQSDAESAAGELKALSSAEEGLAYLRKIRENAGAGREFANV
jgi:hypothetical protein